MEVFGRDGYLLNHERLSVVYRSRPCDWLTRELYKRLTIGKSLRQRRFTFCSAASVRHAR